MQNFAVFLLAVIVCSHLLFSVEGRQIKSVRKFDSKQSNQVDNSAAIQKDDDRHQPAAHDSVSASATKEVLPPAIPAKISDFRASVAGYEDGFRHTTPGNSPGAGHSFAGNIDKDTEQKSRSISPTNAKHSTAGGKEDFRPTNPGHSPGAGHAFPNKNSKPNA